jgi:hypothetical protein
VARPTVRAGFDGAKRQRLLVVWGLLVLTLAMCSGLAWGTPQPEFLSPDSAAYTPTQRVTLVAASQELERLLRDATLGSQRTLGEGGWASLDFAAFAAGSLAVSGYRAVVVSGAWSTEQHAWVAVAVDLGDGTIAWIPVEAAPTANSVATTLGRIAWGNGGQYDERYTRYDQVMELGANAAPIAAVRGPVAAPDLGEIVRFLALTSHDPDGQIVLYVWSVDEGDVVAMTKTGLYDHTFERDGYHTVTLTVVDSRGGRATASATIRVVGPDNVGGKAGSSCGCGP